MDKLGPYLQYYRDIFELNSMIKAFMRSFVRSYTSLPIREDLELKPFFLPDGVSMAPSDMIVKARLALNGTLSPYVVLHHITRCLFFATFGRTQPTMIYGPKEIWKWFN
jgi:hypothetical protein